MGELSLLGCLGTVVFLDFSTLKVTVSSSALQLETCYGIVASPYLFIFTKLSIHQNGSFSCSCGALLQQLWHEMLGHLIYKYLQELHKQCMVYGYGFSVHLCPLGAVPLHSEHHLHWEIVFISLKTVFSCSRNTHFDKSKGIML